MIQLREATQKDIESFYKGNRPAYTMRGIVADLDGEIIGIGGYHMYKGNRIIFCEIKEHAKKYRKQILLAARMVIKMYGAGRTFAVCDATQPTAKRFLEHLGFFCIREDLNLYCREVD